MDEQNERKQGGIHWRVLTIALLCAFAGGMFGSVFAARSQEEAPVAEIAPTASIEFAADDTEKTMTPQRVFTENVASVVAINNETTTNVFGQTAAAASSGSGFILSEDGYILTNYHVIQNAGVLTAVLHDGTRCEAALIGSDQENDLALLKIDADGLRAVQLGNSAELQVGEVVCAIGNPLGELTNTLTAGYISALDREINTDGAPINMMQTDCAINAGNSGGPLFDMNGNVVAIITAKYYGDTIEGLGFAIPINDAAAIVADLKACGYVRGRAKLGITALDIDARAAELYSLPRGVYVYRVEESGCAARAGIRERDIITAVGGKSVETMTELFSALRSHRAGEQVVLHLMRDGDEIALPVTLDEKLPHTEENRQT